MVEYHKVYFHCCSAQCQDTFNARPRLYSSGVTEGREPIFKQRQLHLAESLDKEKSVAIADYLNALMGVRSVVIKDRSLQIEYDLWQVTQSHIENRLRENNIHLDNDLLQRLRRAWIHIAEDNELDNRAHPPVPCCNYPPQY